MFPTNGHLFMIFCGNVKYYQVPSSQNSKFVMSLRYFKKEVKDEVDFLYAGKHQSFRQVDFKTFFSIWVFFHNHSRITGLQGKGEGIYLTPYYRFQPLSRLLNISWAISAESSPLHIGSSQTRTGILWFPSASC